MKQQNLEERGKQEGKKKKIVEKNRRGSASNRVFLHYHYQQKPRIID